MLATKVAGIVRFESCFGSAAGPLIRSGQGLVRRASGHCRHHLGSGKSLRWTAYDGAMIRLQQGKTGTRVVIPASAVLRAALDAMPRTSPVILLNSEGKPWTSDGFRSSWRKACKACGIEGLTFHDLRGTAVSRLALAQCSVAEIATLTGHSLNDVGAILEAHYLNRDPALAISAIGKLETGTQFPDRLSDRA